MRAAWDPDSEPLSAVLEPLLDRAKELGRTVLVLEVGTDGVAAVPWTAEDAPEGTWHRRPYMWGGRPGFVSGNHPDGWTERMDVYGHDSCGQARASRFLFDAGKFRAWERRGDTDDLVLFFPDVDVMPARGRR
jgi:hypothetical protein